MSYYRSATAVATILVLLAVATSLVLLDSNSTHHSGILTVSRTSTAVVIPYSATHEAIVDIHDPYLDRIKNQPFLGYPGDPSPWKRMAEFMTERVHERLRNAKTTATSPLSRLCSLPYHWTCGMGKCFPKNNMSEVVHEVEGRVYKIGDPIACGPILVIDHRRKLLETLSIKRVVLRHATSMKYVNSFWETMFNSAAFTDMHGVANLLGLIPTAEHPNFAQFPRNNMFVKMMCVHSALALSSSIEVVFLVDNDAYFTREAFRLQQEEVFLGSFFPDTETWSFAMQDDMPFDELCAGLFAVRRTAWTADFLQEWWNSAAPLPPGQYPEPYANLSMGCCWYHPHDQICLKALLFKRLSGHNGFNATLQCSYRSDGWFPQAVFARGQPDGLLDAMKRKNVWPGLTQNVSWVREGKSLIVNGNLFVKNLSWTFNHSSAWSDEALEPIVPAFLSQYSWPEVHFVRWNRSLKLHAGAFHYQLTPFPHQKSLIYHTGGNLYKCIRKDVPFNEHGRIPPKWAQEYLPMNTTHVPVWADITKQKKCISPEMWKLMKRKGKIKKPKRR